MHGIQAQCKALKSWSAAQYYEYSWCMGESFYIELNYLTETWAYTLNENAHN